MSIYGFSLGLSCMKRKRRKYLVEISIRTALRYGILKQLCCFAKHPDPGISQKHLNILQDHKFITVQKSHIQWALNNSYSQLRLSTRNKDFAILVTALNGSCGKIISRQAFYSPTSNLPHPVFSSDRIGLDVTFSGYLALIFLGKFIQNENILLS